MAIDICVQLGKNLRDVRKGKGWRQVDLAQHAGVHEVHISDLEQGKREVGLRTLHALARALEVTMADLLRGVE